MNCTVLNCNNKLSRRGLCQTHYRQERAERMARGERATPGPKQDPTKPYSKYKPKTRRYATDTHCIHGHEFEVVGFYLNKTGKKQCKVCRNNSQRRIQGWPEKDTVGIPNKDKTHCPKGHEYAGDNLYIHPTSGYRRCLTCHTANTREWRLKNLYDLSVEEYDRMLEEQGNSCSICAKSFDDFQPVVDHDHDTGAVRAVLCTHCNTGLGQFFDDAQTLQKAIDYLAKFSQTTPQ